MSQQRNGSPNALLAAAGGPLLTSGRDLLSTSVELKAPTSVLHYPPASYLYGQQLPPQPSVSPPGGTYAQMLSLMPAATGSSPAAPTPGQKQEYKLDYPVTTQLASPTNSASSASASAENASFSGASSPGGVPISLAAPIPTPTAHPPGAPGGPFKPSSGAINGPSAPFVRVRTTSFYCFLSLYSLVALSL